MDLKQAKAILAKFGEDNCLQIIFDNGRVWLTNVPVISDDPIEAIKGLPKRDEKGNVVFHKFADIVKFDEATETIIKLERVPGAYKELRDKVRWKIVNPIECIQGFNFLPEDASEKEKQFIREQWDHTIV